MLNLGGLLKRKYDKFIKNIIEAIQESAAYFSIIKMGTIYSIRYIGKYFITKQKRKFRTTATDHRDNK